MSKPTQPQVGCQASEYGQSCPQLGRTVGFGIRLCPEHERKLMRWLLKRERDREAHKVAEAACGDHWNPAIDPGSSHGFWEAGSAGAPTLGKDR